MRLAAIFNGHLVLNKTNLRFTKWLKVLKVSRIKTVGEVCLNNGWFSGFVDAEGSFYSRIRIQKTFKTGREFIYKFSLNQAEELTPLTKILTLFKSKSSVFPILNNNRTNISVKYYGIAIRGLESTALLLKYFEQYPCLGRKKRAIQIYTQLNMYVTNKQHLTHTGLDKMQKLCNLLTKYNLRI